MPRLNSPAQLSEFREEIRRDLHEKLAAETVITVGMGTCGLAAGAGDTYRAIQKELEARQLSVTLRSVGCIGMCVREPLVDIQLPGEARVTYANVSPGRIPRLIEEHLVHGQVVQEWAVGYVPTDW
jgi:(2Fe-2S) ferredoxin